MGNEGKLKNIIKVLLLILIVSFITSCPDISAKQKLPAYYKNENITSVKNQGQWNLCWMFAAVSAMESELIKNNGYDTTLNLSEHQLAYFYFNNMTDLLGQRMLARDEIKSINEGSSSFDAGINMFNGVSPIESDYEPFEVENGELFSKDQQYTNAFHIEKVMEINEPDNIEQIKNWIMEYGAVAFSYHSGNDYNPDTFGYYTPQKEYSNHAVCIVGWDDKYSKTNFNVQPKADGAWIVKNSWGSEWGDKGYFYISYYDMSLDRFTCFDIEPGKATDNLYQNCFDIEDYPYYVINEDVDTYANVFIANGNPKGAEELDSVAVCFSDACEYNIDIYKNVKVNTDPQSGSLVDTLTGKVDCKGIYKINLNKKVYISEGEMFSIVVSAKDKDGNPKGVERSHGFRAEGVSTLGQSFVYTYFKYDNDIGYVLRVDTKSWRDIATTEGVNLYIKAYTNNIDKDTTQKMVTPKIAEIEGWTVTDPVSELKNSFVSSDSVILEWKGIPTAEGYFIYEYVSSNKVYRCIGYTTDTFYKVSGLSPNKNYSFAVKACKHGKRLGYFSDDIDFLPWRVSDKYVKVSVKTSPKVPAATVAASKKGPVIKWGKISDADGYKVYVMSPETDYEWTEIASLSKGKTSYTDTSVKKGLTYSYRVYAMKGKKIISKSIPVAIDVQ